MRIQGLDGYELFGKVKANKREGWREVIRDERALVRSIILNMQTIRGIGRMKMDLNLMNPDWATFKGTEYYREMARYLDTRMIRKYRAYWELFLDCGIDNRRTDRLLLMWKILIAETMKRNHGKGGYDWTRFLNGMDMNVGQKIFDGVMSRYEDLTLS